MPVVDYEGKAACAFERSVFGRSDKDSVTGDARMTSLHEFTSFNKSNIDRTTDVSRRTARVLVF